MNFKKYLYIAMIPAVTAMTGCDKLSDFGDTNVNPNATESPVPSALMTNAQVSLGGYASQTRGGLYGQYFSETQYTDVSLYSLPQLNFSGEYSGVLNDLQTIINTNQSNNMTQVSRIIQQYIFWTITDRWGDVPYSEALKGLSNLRPKFDRQEDIYKGILAILADANSKFDNTSIITGDVIYGGNVAKWKKAANSLRMLVALQLSKKVPSPTGFAATEFKAALNDPAGHIETNADNMTLDYPGGNFKNPWFNAYNGRKDFAESKTMTDLMSSLGDARQTAFGGATEQLSPDPNWDETSNVGVPYGLVRAKAEAFTAGNPTWARILRGDLRQEDDPIVIIGAAHVLLARAEAADYGWTTDNVATVYQRGIQLSFEEWGLPAPSATYFTQSNVALSAAPGTGGNLRQIATQRYIAFYPNGLQAWNIWRKTGFPALSAAPDATNEGKQIPRRYTYGQNEYGSNPDATNAAAALIPGGDDQDSRVWWDQQ